MPFCWVEHHHLLDQGRFVRYAFICFVDCFCLEKIELTFSLFLSSSFLSWTLSVQVGLVLSVVSFRGTAMHEMYISEERGALTQGIYGCTVYNISFKLLYLSFLFDVWLIHWLLYWFIDMNVMHQYFLNSYLYVTGIHLDWSTIE